MVVFLADSSGQPANRIVLSLQNWTFLPVTLIQVLYDQFRGGGGLRPSMISMIWGEGGLVLECVQL